MYIKIVETLFSFIVRTELQYLLAKSLSQLVLYITVRPPPPHMQPHRCTIHSHRRRCCWDEGLVFHEHIQL